jgi:hypothetical protein
MNSIHWLIDQHIYEIAEKSPQQQFKSNHSVSCNKTKNKNDKNQCGHNILTKYETMTFVMNASD